MNDAPLNHEQRLALINRPFFIVTMNRSYTWAGLILGDRFPRGRDGLALLYDDDDLAITKLTVVSALDAPITWTDDKENA